MQILRRKQPRRLFSRDIGLLIQGRFFVVQALQIGEGGLLISSDHVFDEGQSIVVTFKLPNFLPAVVRGKIVYRMPEDPGQLKYGIAFDNLESDTKKAIRSYVALKPSEEGAAERSFVLQSLKDPSRAA